MSQCRFLWSTHNFGYLSLNFSLLSSSCNGVTNFIDTYNIPNVTRCVKGYVRVKYVGEQKQRRLESYLSLIPLNQISEIVVPVPGNPSS